MILITLGQQGSGKTLFLVREGYKGFQRGMKIYSNFKLGFPHTLLDFKDIVESNLQNAIVILDEAHLWGLNSRDAMSKKNKLITSQFLVQCRKQGVLLYVCSQYLRQLDVRVRENADYILFCKKYLFDKDNNKVCEAVQSRNYRRDVPIIIEVEWNDIGQDKTAYQYFFGNELYTLYDTREVIHIQDIEKVKDEQTVTSYDEEEQG